MEETITVKKADMDYIKEQFSLMMERIQTLDNENSSLKQRLEPLELKELVPLEKIQSLNMFGNG